jgi:hypothetical protein
MTCGEMSKISSRIRDYSSQALKIIFESIFYFYQFIATGFVKAELPLPIYQGT